VAVLQQVIAAAIAVAAATAAIAAAAGVVHNGSDRHCCQAFLLEPVLN
jgi:hypothetical protein